MRKLNKKRISLGITAAILLLALAFYAWYTKPVTLSELYPMLELDKCTQIQGYYEIGTQAEPSEFTIAKNSGEFETLYNLFYEQRYCRSLRDLFPRGTTEQVAWIVSNFPNLDGFALTATRDCNLYDPSWNKVPGTLIVGKRKPSMIIQGNEKRIERYVKNFELLKQKYKGVPYKQAFRD